MTGVTVNSINYDGSILAKTLVTPSTFTLNVLSPCATTTVTASTASDISLKVWDTQAYYPSSGFAFTDFTDLVQTANSDSSMCPKTYTATVSNNAGGNSLSNFSLDSALREFLIYSGNYNQIGTFTVTIRGEVTEAPTKFATTTFTITVVDPCLTTALDQPTPPANLDM